MLRGVFLFVMACMMAPSPACAAELVMFTQRGCVWCATFDREIAPAYEKTSEGKRAPLRRVDIHSPLPADIAFIRRERFTPVFVLVDGGHEVGRVRGYPGDTFFYGLLDNLIERMDRGERAPDEPLGPPPPGATVAD